MENHGLLSGFTVRMPRRTVQMLAACAALALSAVPALLAPPAAHAAFGVPVLVPKPEAPAPPAVISSTLTSAFSPDRLGARGALTFSIRYSDSEPDVFSPEGKSSVPPPVRKVAVRFPAGMGLEIPHLSACSAARLRARGLHGCPASSRVGGGHALTELIAGSQILSERITLTAFIGPLHNGQSTLAILGEGFTPLGERVVFVGEMGFAHAPYGEELVIKVPPIHALPATPDASPVLFTLTLGIGRHRRSSVANTVIVPSRCPTGGFPFAAESSFADGSSGSVLARAQCP
jgi:hypothetical protein